MFYKMLWSACKRYPHPPCRRFLLHCQIKKIKEGEWALTVQEMDEQTNKQSKKEFDEMASYYK